METTNPVRVSNFWSKVNKNGPFCKIEDIDLGRCWIWTGACDGKYGNFAVAKNKVGKAHRFSFKLAFGWLLSHPYQIDHKCRETMCVNPKHLFCLLGRDNNERSNSPSAINKRKTHCIRGHEFTEDNIIRFKDGYRRCKTCI
jgi:hypothetical protein